MEYNSIDDWGEEMDQHKKETQSVSEFYKFAIGSHVMRIMTKPVRKASRFGYGVCYPGASYCDPAVLEKEYQEKCAAYELEVNAARIAKKTPQEIKMIKKPSRPNISVKWSVWALVRTAYDEKGRANPINELKIIDMPGGVSEKLLELARDKEMGTAFSSFPMPYDVKIIVAKKDTKGRTWTPKDVEYSLIAGQKHTPVTEEEAEPLTKKKSIQDIIDLMGAKAQRDHEGEGPADVDHTPDYPQDDINPDDIPF